MILWRIGATTRSYLADDLSGAGAASYPGRWNDAGQHVIYAASSLALAVLETAAHIDDAGLPLNRYVVRIEVPDALWRSSRTTHSPATIPVGWDSIPCSRVALEVGSAWYARAAHLFLEVPSVVVPEESAVLINATMPQIASFSAKATRRYDYNALFRR